MYCTVHMIHWGGIRPLVEHLTQYKRYWERSYYYFVLVLLLLLLLRFIRYTPLHNHILDTPPSLRVYLVSQSRSSSRSSVSQSKVSSILPSPSTHMVCTNNVCNCCVWGTAWRFLSTSTTLLCVSSARCRHQVFRFISWTRRVLLTDFSYAFTIKWGSSLLPFYLFLVLLHSLGCFTI